MQNNCSYLNCNYEVYQDDKCIFHCEKTTKNGWIVDSDDKYTKWNENIKLFWKKFIEAHQTNIIQSFSDFGFSEGFIIPFYHTNLANGVRLQDIRELKDIKFFGATFVDDFIIYDGKGIEKFSLSECNFQKECYFANLDVKYFFAIQNSFVQGLTIRNSVIEDSEIMDMKSNLSNELISFNLSDSIIKSKLEIWQCNSKINIDISNCNFNDLELKKLDIVDIKFEYSNVFKHKIKFIDIKVDCLHLNNIDFEEDSKILFENIKTNKFTIKQLSQDSKYIQFNNIEVNQKLNFYKVEFHNTYFNDCDFSEAHKSLGKLTFINAYLNSVNWGNKNTINTSREIFRDLKVSYDNIKNYIEANNFFVMEMKRYKKELKGEKLSSYWQEKLVFFLNEKISNFSQSWFLPLLWIFIISQLAYIFSKSFENIYFELPVLISMTIIFWIIGRFFYERFQIYTFQHIMVVIALFIDINYFHYGNINDILQFTYIQKFDTESNMKFSIWMIHKMIMGFLIYHFVIALRRQTRR